MPEATHHAYAFKVIRHHITEGTIDSRVFHCAEDSECLHLIEFSRPRDSNEEEVESASDRSTQREEIKKKLRAPQTWYVPAPRVLSFSELKAGLDDGTYSVADFELPPQAKYVDEDLFAGKVPDALLRASRATPAEWVRTKNEIKEIIKPIFEHDNYALLEGGLLQQQIAKRAEELGHKTSARVRRFALLYLLSARQDWILYPLFGMRGGLGTKKISKKKTGKPNPEAARHRDDPQRRRETAGQVCSEVDRQKLRLGYVCYKKRGVSVERAWLQTSEEYYAKSVKFVGSGKSAKREVELKHPSERPTLSEFKRWGPSEEDRASRINIGVRKFKLQHSASYNSIRKSPLHLGVKALIDSTSEDQTLVSEASRLKVIGTSHRTVVVIAGLGYILGVYSGPESPSTLTALLAVLNCAEDKVAYCARHGRVIQAGEWISFMPRGIFADNGELKSELGIATLTACDVSLTFTRAYDPKPKQEVEHSHLKLHRDVDHANHGSTQGRSRERGETPLSDEASLKHSEHVPLLIDAILDINNVEEVPDLLTMEMRRDGVKPTRRAILEWTIENGYVTSEPTNLETLRVRCLPKLKAVITAQGVQIFDPRRGKTHTLIKNLLYESVYLHQSGLAEKARRKRIGCEVHIDPSDLSTVWLAGVGNLQRLELCSSDPELGKVVLRDWLEICDEDDLALHLNREFRENAYATRVSNQQHVNAQAKREKKKEMELATAGDAPEGEDAQVASACEDGDSSGTESNERPKRKTKAITPLDAGKIRENRAEEVEQRRLERLGLSESREARSDASASAADPSTAGNKMDAIAQANQSTESKTAHPPAGKSPSSVVSGAEEFDLMDVLRGRWKR